MSNRTKIGLLGRASVRVLLSIAVIFGVSLCASGTSWSIDFVILIPVVDCDGDNDGDGLTNCEEDLDQDGVWDEEDGETDPENADTDGDGLIDGEEGDRDGDGVLGPDESDPLEADTDGDGLEDGDEARIGTKRNTCDTDEDGLSDGIEMGKIQPDDINGCHGLQAAGTNFHNPYAMDPLNPDSDADGLEDGEEDLNGNGWCDPEETDPTTVDTDRDGIEDGVEMLGDFDGDGIPDFDYRLVQGEGDCTPPEDISDLDCDGIPNGRDDDSDNDGCPDAQEGGWLDANGNGIPDVFDNESKTCPEPASDVGVGGGGQPGDTDDDSGLSSTSSMYVTDAGACRLKGEDGGDAFPRSVAGFLLFLVLAFILYRKAPGRGLTSRN